MSANLLPDQSVLVHIGPHKTGSTSLQIAMHESREVLAQHGVLYPSGPYRPRKAGWAIGLPTRPGGQPVPSIDHWHRLVDEVTGTSLSRACVSNESFGRADSDQVKRIVDDLGGDRVHVVAVVRPLMSLLPSMWQERVKAGLSTAYDDWLAATLREDGDDYNYRYVWHAHDPEALVHRWTEHVPADRFTLVVMDESDRLQMSRLFEQMLGLPEGMLAARPGGGNESLAVNEIELVREANLRLEQLGVPKLESRQLMRRVVAAIRDHDGPRLGPRKPPMPEWAAERVREISEQRALAVEKLSVPVVGEPGSIRAGDIPTGDVDPADVMVSSSLAADVLSAVIAAAVAGGAGDESSTPRAEAESASSWWSGLTRRLGR